MADFNDLRRRLATIIEDEEPRSRVTRLFDTALALLIIVNVSGVILESVESIRRHFAVELDLLEHTATVIFAFGLLFAVPREERQSISAATNGEDHETLRA